MAEARTVLPVFRNSRTCRDFKGCCAGGANCGREKRRQDYLRIIHCRVPRHSKFNRKRVNARPTWLLLGMADFKSGRHCDHLINAGCARLPVLPKRSNDSVPVFDELEEKGS